MKQAFLVFIPGDKPGEFEMRSSNYDIGGTTPPEYGAVVDIVIAETPAEAKYYFLNDWAGSRDTGVYHDDWNALRVRKLLHDVKEKKGVLAWDSELWDRAWGRVHEAIDHNNTPCDCIKVLDDDFERDIHN